MEGYVKKGKRDVGKGFRQGGSDSLKNRKRCHGGVSI